MTDSQIADGPKILIAGCGAAGQAYAAGFHMAGACVWATDPFAGAASHAKAQQRGIALDSNLPETLDDFDLAVILTPASASLDLARQFAERSGLCPVLDLTSSSPSAMKQAATLLGDRFVDGVVLGAVGLGGLATPMALAGKNARRTADMLQGLGCCVSCVDGEPGRASSLKLLRSLFMKGLEALIVETQLAAVALGQTDDLRIALGDLSDVNMPEFLDEMVRTHPKHAARRTEEIEATQALIQSAGMTTILLPAVLKLFSRTASAGPGPDESTQLALNWLDKQFNARSEPVYADT